MKITATTPNRIDLAGGTLDIHPLYIFENGGMTVNLGIDLESRVELETREDKRIVLTSHDLGLTREYESLSALKSAPPFGGPLDLLARAVVFFEPSTGLTLRTRNDAPRGSGLGASSALLMAMFGALSRLEAEPPSIPHLIDWGANLEAQNLAIPTGKQDYFAAIYGGLSAIWFELRGNRHEAIEPANDFLSVLDSHIVLSFTGVSHFSGTNNWNMMKRYIDREGDTVERLGAIRETAHAMREAVSRGDIQAIAEVLDEEWRHRKELAEGVSTPEIDRMVASARRAGAYASKICGAGGGGCLFTLAPPSSAEQVRKALRAEGAQPLPCHIRRHGLHIETTHTVEVHAP